ncbi:MAG: AmmeMemoRadiSam system protein B [Deltaproteobacteria bacterium]|nr:AmmeMemoRadiSam system protein B [Deltaproteobacteria bacterium]
MSGVLEYPKLRWPLEMRLESIEDQEVLLINCPIGVATKPLLLIPAVAPILSCFQGNLSVSDITAKFAPHGVSTEIIRELIGLLDEHLFLASPKFFAAQKNMLDEFAAAETRPPSMAGLGYPLEPALLKVQLQKYLNGNSQAGEIASATSSLIGLVSPHIDYRRGSACYGATYRYLEPHCHDLYLLIGTAHQYSRYMFHLSCKHFDTPLGLLPCDKSFVSKLSSLYGADRSFADEILHRKEHSLELQLPFLSYLKPGATIAPILVGSFHQMIASSKHPSHFEMYERFAESLTACLRDHLGEGRSFSFIAGVDMAHVGRSFGDTDSLSPKRMEEVAERDQIYLKAIESQDKEALFSHVAEDGDARRICGFPTMYLVIDVLERLGIKYKAKTYDYRQAIDYDRECAVTFAGMGLYI